jgi:hypothetical protein
MEVAMENLQAMHGPGQSILGKNILVALHEATTPFRMNSFYRTPFQRLHITI